jgi:hypothetical protein
MQAHPAVPKRAENRTTRHLLSAYVELSRRVKLLPIPQCPLTQSLTQKEPTMPAILAFQTLPAQTTTTHEAMALSISSCDSNSCRR